MIARWILMLLVPSAAAIALGQEPAAAGAGAKIFTSTCAACHTIGEGRRLGPDLRDVTARRSEAWIIHFVQHPQATIAAGDPVAKGLAAEAQGFVMPDQALSEADIRGVLAYITSHGGGAAAAPAAATAVPSVAPEPTSEQVQLGRALFDGRRAFAAGGPACHSCHDVASAGVVGGGSLARDLTSAYTRFGASGVQSILHAPPFPVMQRAYERQPLTDDEVVAVSGFLRQAEAQQALHHAAGVAPRLAAAGLGGSALLLLLYSLIWGARSRESVNEPIYDRQIKST